MADLSVAFRVTRWESGRRAVFTADEDARGGRPFLDAVDVQMARPLRERAIELGRADLVELTPADLRRQPAGQRIWSSRPIRLVALAFAPRVKGGPGIGPLGEWRFENLWLEGGRP